MVPDLRDVVVVGASAAGVSAAKALRRDGFDGRVTVLSADPDPPYRRPPLSKEVLVHAVGDESLRLPVPGDLDLDLRLGDAATALDLRERVVRCASGAVHRFDGLVVATGTAPVNPWSRRELDGVLVLRTLRDARGLRSRLLQAGRVVVVGAGFIGAEVASAARALGREVVLIDALPAPHASVLGERVGMALVALHRDHGTTLRLGAEVLGLEGGEAVSGVQLAGGERVPADLVVVGVGVRPVTGWLTGAGIALGDGIRCDSRCRVLDRDGRMVEGVVAAGDVAHWHNPVYGEPMRVEHWDNAVAQGKAAARTLLGAGEDYAPVPYFWSDQYDTKIQFVGSARAGDDVAIVEGDLADRRFVAAYGRRGRLVGAVTMNLPRSLGRYRNLIKAGCPFPPDGPSGTVSGADEVPVEVSN